MRKIILCIFCLFSLQLVFAQKKIILEQIRCFSSNPQVTGYLQDPFISKVIASQLAQTLSQQQHVLLTDTNNLAVSFLDFYETVSGIKPKFKDADTSNLHLYIDLLETDPFYYFRAPENKPNDSTLSQRTKTVFRIGAWILSSDKKMLFNEKIDIVVSSAETPGMGVLYEGGIGLNNLSVLPYTFTGFLNRCFNVLLDPKNEMSMLEIKLQPAFYLDNYILPKTADLPRTYVSTNKNISTYTLGNKPEMIRMGNPLYEKIITKGKKVKGVPDAVADAAKDLATSPRSDFIYMLQDSRDVLRDKNYRVKILAEINRTYVVQEETVFTNFTKASLNYLLDDQKILAAFSVYTKADGNTSAFYNSYISRNRITNGYDSGYVYRVTTQLKELVQSPLLEAGFSYLVQGTIGDKTFMIRCSGMRNTLKEIYVSNKLVCIAQGKFAVEKFVLFDASLSPELLNQLFIIGFNHFFE